jgi:hypothetical protein
MASLSTMYYYPSPKHVAFGVIFPYDFLSKLEKGPSDEKDYCFNPHMFDYFSNYFPE